MPDTTYLQIQGGDDDATRVVELPGAAIRVGRGSLCEIRLPDPELAEVQCLLRRRGETWHVQPIGPAGLVSIEGEVVEQLRPLPADVALRIGSFRLLIQSAGDYRGGPIEVGRVSGSSEADRPQPSHLGGQRVATVAGSTGAEEDRLRRWQGRLEQRERWLQARQEEKKWEARWRAAGEGLRARAATSQPTRADDGLPPVTSPSGPDRIVAPPVARIVPPAAKPLAPVDRLAPGQSPTAKRSAPPLPDVSSSSAEISDAPRGEDGVSDANSDRSSTSLRILGKPVRVPAARTSEKITRGDEIPTPTTSIDDEAGVSSSAFFEVDPSALSWHHDAIRSPETPTAPMDGRSPTQTPAPSISTDVPVRSGRDRSDFLDAATIFSAQGSRPVPQPERPVTDRGRKASRSVPTEPGEPARWSVPAFVALPTAALAAVALLGAGVFLAFAWTGDNLSAGLAARAAMRAESEKPVPLDPTERVETRWWKTTPLHLALWSAAIELSPDASTRPDEVIDAIDSARRAAPLQSSLRYASAQPDGVTGASSASFALGLSRDVESLTLTGRMLSRSGKGEPAIRAYRRALEIASEAETSSLAPPGFDDDPRMRRFRLAHEDIVARVIRDMMEAGAWGFAEWSVALPPRAIVRLTAARLLREKGDPDSERALAAVLADEVEVPSSPAAASEHHAARAEALAFTEHKAEAAVEYRRAIELADDDVTRRRNRLALAEILASIGELRERAEILEAAKGIDPTDPVSRKVLEAQQFAGLK